MTPALIALGANLHRKREQIQFAFDALQSENRIHDLAVSQLYETAPVGGPGEQDDFVNAAAFFRTDFSARELLKFLLDTEIQMGRVREIRWQARTLDLDLLIFGDQRINEEDFEVPHPRMSFRRFVLEPASEVAPDLKNPAAGMSIKNLLERINSPQNSVAICGTSDEVDKLLSESQTLLEKTAEHDSIEFERIAGSDAEIEQSSASSGRSNLERIDADPANSDSINSEIANKANGANKKSGTVYRIATFHPDNPRQLLCENYIPAKLLVIPASSQNIRGIESGWQSYNPGPYLVLDFGSPEQAAVDFVAALQAMQ